MEHYAASPDSPSATSGYIQNAQRDARTPVYDVPGTPSPKGGYDPFGRPVPNTTAQVKGPEIKAQPWVCSPSQSKLSHSGVKIASDYMYLV